MTRTLASGRIFFTIMEKNSNAEGTGNALQWAAGPLPAVYRIVVSGRLDSSWQGRLGAMEFSVNECPGGATTVLEGRIRDRAELSGILNTLFDFHLTLLRVEVVEDLPKS